MLSDEVEAYLAGVRQGQRGGVEIAYAIGGGEFDLESVLAYLDDTGPAA